jgi:quercetin dioxygenase-like cupin family protein
MMKDRQISKREPEYKELISGHSSHLGELVSLPASTMTSVPNTKTDPYDDPTYNQPVSLIANETRESILTKPRLREAPSTRFSGGQHFLDVLPLSAHLQAETHLGAHGHRQITIFHQGDTTIVLFVFEAGGKLASYKANGLVTIHVLDGALTVETDSEAKQHSHDLHAHQILVLSPGVLHSVTAHQQSRMLLTIHLGKDTAVM